MCDSYLDRRVRRDRVCVRVNLYDGFRKWFQQTVHCPYLNNISLDVQSHDCGCNTVDEKRNTAYCLAVVYPTANRRCAHGSKVGKDWANRSCAKEDAHCFNNLSRIHESPHAPMLQVAVNTSHSNGEHV